MTYKERANYIMFYKELKELKKRVIQSKKESTRSTIRNMFENWEEFTACWWYKENITPTKAKESKTRQREFLIKKLKRQEEKYINEQINKIDEVNQAEPVRYLSIICEWWRSSTWGMCPSVETRSGEYHIGGASGCGYDKLSSAIAQALNQDKRVLKRLYTLAEKGLRQGKKTFHEIIGYGSGYGSLPYFEGGVGYTCFKSMFDKMNATVNTWSEGKTSDHMRIEWSN